MFERKQIKNTYIYKIQKISIRNLHKHILLDNNTISVLSVLIDMIKNYNKIKEKLNINI